MPLLRNAEEMLLKIIDKMRRVFLLPLMLVLVSISVKAQNDETMTKMNVMGGMMNLRNALLSKDSIALSKVLADEVTYGHTNGLTQSKAELITSVMSGEQEYKSIDPYDINVRAYGNTAIVNMKSKVEMNYQGKPLDLNMKILLVWINKDEVWKLVARQSTKL